MDPRQNSFQNTIETTPMQIDKTQPPSFFPLNVPISPIIPFNPKNPPPTTNSYGFISQVSF